MTEQARALAPSRLSAAGVGGRVYLAVKAAGPVGVSTASLRSRRDFRGLNAAAVENALYRLKSLGHIAFDRQEHFYFVDAKCLAPNMYYPRPDRAPLLALVADCEAGVAVQLLADEFCTTPDLVLQVLARDLHLGSVLKITMPESHGGGIGLAPNQAWKPTAQTATSDAPAPAVPPLVVPIFVGSAPMAPGPVGGRGAFELLPTGQFSIGWGAGFQLVLPRDVTREMFRFLDRLGGLHTVSRLGQAEPDASAEAAS